LVSAWVIEGERVVDEFADHRVAGAQTLVGGLEVDAAVRRGLLGAAYAKEPGLPRDLTAGDRNVSRNPQPPRPKPVPEDRLIDNVILGSRRARSEFGALTVDPLVAAPGGAREPGQVDLADVVKLCPRDRHPRSARRPGGSCRRHENHPHRQRRDKRKGHSPEAKRTGVFHGSPLSDSWL